jgi:hypothetical protein
MRHIAFYLLVALLLSACKTDNKAGKAAVITTATDTTAQISEDESFHLSEITAEQFSALYKGKHKMHFKGTEDEEKVVLKFKAGKDSAEYVPEHYENAHDLYISKFTTTGFDFTLDTYTTPSPCLIKGKAQFTNYNTANYTDTLGCNLDFFFYKDTLQLFSQGCHLHYCGAYASLGELYVLQKR